jgi:hypothetical protein
MQKTLLFLLTYACLLSSLHATTPPISTPPRDETPLLIRYIMKQCDLDSTTVTTMVHRLHTLYRIKRVEFVCSTTDANYYLRGGILRMNVSDSNKMCDVWLAELSHAIQFTDQPVKYSLMTIRDGVDTFFDMFFLSKKERVTAKLLRELRHCSRFKAKFWIAWKRNEYKKSTLEHNAHQEIEVLLTDFVVKNFYGPL